MTKVSRFISIIMSRRSLQNTLAISRNRCELRRYRYPRAWHSWQKTFPNFPTRPNRTAVSTAEAEYYSASAAGCEVLYLRALLDSLGFKQKKPTPIYEDNTACIEWGNNVIGGRERAKHIDILKHFAYEVIQNGAMLLIKVLTAQQMVDILTKGLHLPQVLACVDGLLGRKSAPST